MQNTLPEFPRNIAGWQEWVYRHEQTKTMTQRAARHRARFTTAYLFHYWRFHASRNRTLRAAWVYFEEQATSYLMWSALVAFRVNVAIRRRERALRGQVLRHWHAVMRHSNEYRGLHLSALMVSSSASVFRLKLDIL